MSFFFFSSLKYIKKYHFFFSRGTLGQKQMDFGKCLALIGLHFGREVLMGSVHTHYPLCCCLLLSSQETHM